jgi:hypothetical protein
MKDPTTGKRVFGRTRWRRFGLLMVPGVGAVVALMFLVATGAIAVSFQMSGLPFTLKADNLSGTGFVQYATVDQVSSASSEIPAGSAIGNNVADTVTVLQNGTIANLDQTVCAPAGPLGNVLVTIAAGGSGQPAVSFSDLVANAPLLTAGQATFTNINIGEDLNSAIPGAGAPAGSFSQAAEKVSIDNVKQVSVGTSASSFTLPGLTLSATFVSACPS